MSLLWVRHKKTMEYRCRQPFVGHSLRFLPFSIPISRFTSVSFHERTSTIIFFFISFPYKEIRARKIGSIEMSATESSSLRPVTAALTYWIVIKQHSRASAWAHCPVIHSSSPATITATPSLSQALGVSIFFRLHCATVNRVVDSPHKKINHPLFFFLPSVAS